MLIPQGAFAEGAQSAIESTAKGDSMLEKKNFDAAIDAYTNVIRLDSTTVRMLTHKRGHACNEKNDFDKAIADEIQAIKL